MKVKIELNNYITLELEDDNNIRIWFEEGTVTQKSASVSIDDLRLAIRKLTAK